MKKFSIGYFGDGAWAHNAFKKIIKDESLEIRFVCVRYDNRDKVLTALAEDIGITVHYVDEGIDTGDIILQRVYEIMDEENYATLLDRAHTYIGIPGQVVGKGTQSFFVKTKDR